MKIKQQMLFYTNFSFFTRFITSIAVSPINIPVGIEDANITNRYGIIAADDIIKEITRSCPILWKIAAITEHDTVGKDVNFFTNIKTKLLKNTPPQLI